MTKKAAIGTILKLGTGLVQVEQATVIGTIDTAGNANVIITAAGMNGSPLTKLVAMAHNDAAAVVAGKIRTALAADADISTMFTVEGEDEEVILRRLIVVDTDATLNIAIDNGNCTGLTAAPSSTSLPNSEIFNAIGNIQKIEGPDLSLDLDDATTLDQASAFEESVATILRSGSVTLDMLYDPSLASHRLLAGLLYKIKNKIFSNFQLIFPDGLEWDFQGVPANFKPGLPHDGKMSAAVSIKGDREPTFS